jgi:hypothetical protein
VWSQLAYTWDGVTGQFNEYINGVSTGRALPVVTGSFRLGTGSLAIGAGNVMNTQACPTNGEGSFQGAIDEVRLFTHARSNRSVCLTTYGSDCKDEAIQVSPTGGQFGMNQQQPGCNAYAALGTQACASAMHRVCAQRGANDALATSTNVYETIQQLIGNRPPISLLGVPAGATTTDVSVACAPIQHQSLAVTFEELARRHAGCTDERVAQSFDCSAAVHRWCNGLGWTTGQIFETTTRPWVGCFNAGLIQDVPKDQLGPASNAGNFTSADSKLEVSRWCQGRGYGAGVVQELGAGSIANVHCFQPAVTVPWKFTP